MYPPSFPHIIWKLIFQIIHFKKIHSYSNIQFKKNIPTPKPIKITIQNVDSEKNHQEFFFTNNQVEIDGSKSHLPVESDVANKKISNIKIFQ